MFAEISLLPPESASHIVLLNFADGVGASIAENGRKQEPLDAFVSYRDSVALGKNGRPFDLSSEA